MSTILVTGFGPFPTMPRNPSAALARTVGASPRLRVLGIAARVQVLTTSYAAIERELAPSLRDGPDAVLMIGVAGRARKIRIETRGTSRRSTLFPDVAGERAGPDGAGTREPAVRRTKVATPLALRRIRERSLPVRLSRDAGRYLCNASYHRALREPCLVLFVHIPKPSGRRPMAGPPGRKVRMAWNERLAAALVDVAIDLARQARVEGRAGLR